MASESGTSARVIVQEEIVTGARGDDDLRKRNSGGGITDQFRRSVDASSDLFSGVADAVSDGFRTFNGSVDNDRLMDVAIDNGYIQGTVAGYAAFFQRLADTANDVLNDIRRASRRQVEEDVEDARRVDRLASAVVARLATDPAFVELLAARIAAETAPAAAAAAHHAAKEDQPPDKGKPA